MEITAGEVLDIQFIMFEVVPLERLGIHDLIKDIYSITLALQHVCFEPPYNFIVKDAWWFSIKDKKQFDECVKRTLPGTEDELIWLLTDFFEYIVLLPTS